MISQILKFALEVIVVAFIAHYVAQKIEKGIDMKDACVIGIGAACVITVIERCFNKREFFDEDYEEEYDSDSEDDSDDYDNVDNTNDQDPALKETKKDAFRFQIYQRKLKKRKEKRSKCALKKIRSKSNIIKWRTHQ